MEFCFILNILFLLLIIVLFIIVLILIIELKKKENNYSKFNESSKQSIEIENSKEELENFIYIISHELKSPLITVKGFLGFLERSVDSGNKELLHNDIKRINQATAAMQLLIDDLIRLSRINRVSEKPEKISIYSVVEDIEEYYSKDISDKGIEIKIDNNLPELNIIKTHIYDLLKELFDNALKFSTSTNYKIIIGYDKTRNIFYIKDNGIGIDLKFHKKVFQIFTKLNKESEGTGIGLAIARKIVEYYDGDIWIESNSKENGITVFFKL